MVLESIVNPLYAERKPQQMILMGFIYTTVAIFLSVWIFRESASLVMVLLTTLACVPLFHNTIRMEEQKDESIAKETTLLKEHGKALSFFIFLFIGIVLASVLWYTVLPADMTQSIFTMQTGTINRVNNAPTGAAVQTSIFLKILFNNMRVLLFCVLFAFVYGVGAIFILTWNATVIGAAIGNFIRTGLSSIATSAGLAKTGGYLSVVSSGLLKYSIHGVPEILAYFTAGLGAGIISVATLRHRLDVEKFKHVVMDSVDLIVIAIALVFVAAIFEVYITPLVF